jgi:hypothetical protein
MVIKQCNYRGISLLSTIYNILPNILVSRLTPYIGKIIGIISEEFDITDKLLTRYPAFIRYWRKNECITEQYISYS